MTCGPAHLQFWVLGHAYLRSTCMQIPAGFLRVFIKHFEMLDILFLSQESYLVDSFFPHVLWNAHFSVFLVFSWMLFSLISIHLDVTFCLSATFSFSSLLWVGCQWNTQVFFGVLLTCIVGPQRSTCWVQMCNRQDSYFKIRQIFVQILPLPLGSCVANHSQPQKPHR